MKVGRNDPCPCGSGKKYKKCCLNKEISFSSSVFDENESLTSKSKKLAVIFKDYKIKDLVTFAFCIASWTINRSCLENCLAINNAVRLQNTDGPKSITTYEDFKKLYELVFPLLPISSSDDFTLSDFGEVKISFHDKFYPVILGTGHEQVYATLQFIPELAKILKKDFLYKELLEYNEKLLSQLSSSNFHGEIEKIVFSLPNKDYYLEVKRLLGCSTFLPNNDELINMLSDSRYPIDRLHFFIYNKQTYPLFNSSLLIDFYSILLSMATEEQKRIAIDMTISRLVNEIYSTRRLRKECPNVLYPVSFADSSKKEVISSLVFTFFASTNKKSIVAINEDAIISSKVNFSKIAKEITELHRQNKLAFVQLYKQKNQNENIGIGISKESQNSIIIYDSFTNANEPRIRLGEPDDNKIALRCSAVDLVSILCIADSIEEIAEYIASEQEAREDKRFVFGGISSHFLVWKQNNQQINPGANRIGMLFVPYGTIDSYIYDYFCNELENYPFSIISQFYNNPFAWSTVIEESSFPQFSEKNNDGFGFFAYKLENNNYVLLTHNMSFFDEEHNFQLESQLAITIDDLNTRLFRRYNSTIVNCFNFKNKIAQFLYMPYSYASSIDGNDFIFAPDIQYVYSDILILNNEIHFRYTPKSDNLLNDIKTAPDKRIECKYLIELFRPLAQAYPEEYKVFSQKITADSSLPKEVNVMQYELDYYFNSPSPQFKVEDKWYTKVRKEISIICQKNEFAIGEYQGESATHLVRTMQKELITNFENEVSKYNRLDLHIHLLSLYSTCQHEVLLHRQRYDLLPENMDDKVTNEIHSKTIEYREKAKENLRILRYLIETNLFLVREKEKKADKDNIAYLLAFSNWLVKLQDVSDLCNFNEHDAHIEVDADYLVNIIPIDNDDEYVIKLNERIYNNNDYIITSSNEQENFEKVLKSFKDDTDIDFMDLIDFLQYLQVVFVEDKGWIECEKNVISYDKNSLEKNFNLCLDKPLASTTYRKMINFLLVDPQKLKEWKGELQFFLPISEREKRPNRFETKILFESDQNIIYSPIMAKTLQNNWQYGLYEFYPPYENDLPLTMESIKEWKRKHEKKMVSDIADLFRLAGFTKVLEEAELYKLDRKGNHPRDLGDYDVIAYDKKRNELWIIESKVMNKVGSVYEDQMQQRNYFQQNKYDVKFQKRIDYISKFENLHSFLMSQKIEANSNTIVKPFMVTNKIFASRYKKIDFPIISYYELKCLLTD